MDTQSDSNNKIDNYFVKESEESATPQVIEESSTKRLRSDGSSTTETPSPKKIALGDDETLLLSDDAPFWVPTLFKSIDKINLGVHVMSSKLDAFKVEVENKINVVKNSAESKLIELEMKFTDKINKQEKSISELTAGMNYISDSFDSQKS